MKIISFFIISFIILLNTTRLYANHSYYCNCEPPAKGTCQCNSQNDHPVTWSNGQPAGKVGIGPWVSTTMWANCTAPNAVILSVDDPVLNIKGASAPNVWRSDDSIACYGPWYASKSHRNAHSTCMNWSIFTKHYVNIQDITCANRGG